jgi:CelD/BcsL family acetyltransferase involved in cellulose biosynthesis
VTVPRPRTSGSRRGDPATAIVPLDRYPDLAVDWCELQDHADSAPFIAWPWISAWLDELPASARPSVFRADDRDGLLALAILGTARGKGLRRVAGPSWHLQAPGAPEFDVVAVEHGDLLVRRGAEPAGYAALLRALDGGRRNWRRLRISGSTHGAAIARALPRTLEAVRVASSVSQVVDLAALRARGGDFPSLLSPRSRQGLRRTRRAYEAHGPLALEVAPDVATALEWFEALSTLNERHWRSRGEHGAFSDPYFLAFHRRLVRRGTATGFTQVMRATAGAVPIGYLYGFAWHGRVHCYNAGLDYEVLGAHDRPGFMVQWLAVERHLADGVDVYDLLGGDQAYKRTLGSPGPTLEWIDVRPRGWRLVAERELARRLRRRPFGDPLWAPVPPSGHDATATTVPSTMPVPAPSKCASPKANTPPSAAISQ